MKSFWNGFIVGFTALFAFFPFNVLKTQEYDDSVAQSWKNVGMYLNRAMSNYEQ